MLNFVASLGARFITIIIYFNQSNSDVLGSNVTNLRKMHELLLYWIILINYLKSYCVKMDNLKIRNQEDWANFLDFMNRERRARYVFMELCKSGKEKNGQLY